jgi:hypothetical protein
MAARESCGRFRFIAACAMSGLAGSGTALADEQAAPDGRGTFSLVVENDVFGDTDQNYTNGLRLSYLTAFAPASGVSGFFARNILGTDPGDGVRQGFALGQSIFTPEDTELSQAPADQHPYAGWLYGEYALLVESENTVDQLYFQAGVVGPSAGGEWVQNRFHDLIGAGEAQGWDDQLDDEPGFVIGYDKKLRALAEIDSLGLGADLTPDVGVTVGNVLTQATLGLTMRVGTDLSSDYGPPRIRPSLAGAGFFRREHAFSTYFFAGVQGRAVGHNIFLDGNSFDDDSPSVDKKYFVADLQAGVVVQIMDVQLAYTYVARTKEFDTQDERQQFGAVSLSFKF